MNTLEMKSDLTGRRRRKGTQKTQKTQKKPETEFNAIFESLLRPLRTFAFFASLTLRFIRRDRV